MKPPRICLPVVAFALALQIITYCLPCRANNHWNDIRSSACAIIADDDNTNNSSNSDSSSTSTSNNSSNSDSDSSSASASTDESTAELNAKAEELGRKLGKAEADALPFILLLIFIGFLGFVGLIVLVIFLIKRNNRMPGQ